jgi:hypothetical protein
LGDGRRNGRHPNDVIAQRSMARQTGRPLDARTGENFYGRLAGAALV